MKIIECPRDAMQGIERFIPTDVKANYINSLLKVGFDTIDFGSFVSPKAMPQMQDTNALLGLLDLSNSNSKLLAIIANRRGAEDAISFEEVTYLGYPLSLSETFQQRNTNRSISQAMEDLQYIQELCVKHEKTLVTYLSMGFGNPYGDLYNQEYIAEFVQKLEKMAVNIIALSDTIGVSTADSITAMLDGVIDIFPTIEFGVHLHARPYEIKEKIAAAYTAGCQRFDGAMMGFGGCPMAKDDLVGNIATETMLSYFDAQNIRTNLNMDAFSESLKIASSIFSQYT